MMLIRAVAVISLCVVEIRAGPSCKDYDDNLSRWATPNTGDIFHIRLRKIKELPRYKEVKSKRCEDHGATTLTNKSQCKYAAQALGRNVVWGPHGGYLDVVDGCSARFEKHNTNMFHNPIGKCDPNDKVGHWTYTACKCASKQPCVCRIENDYLPAPRPGNSLIIGDCVVPDVHGSSVIKTVPCDANDSSQQWEVYSVNSGSKVMKLKNGNYYLGNSGISTNSGTSLSYNSPPEYFSPHLCHCHNQNIMISTSQPDSTYSQYHNAICMDFDECSNPEGYPCPTNSDCKNKVGGYNCVCHDGFAVKDQFPLKVGNPSSICDPMDISATVSASSISASFSITPHESSLENFNMVLSFIDQYRQKYPIEKYLNVDRTGNLLALQPGTNYELGVTGINSQGNEVGTGKGFGVEFTTPCNCDSTTDLSGSPVNLEVAQTNGYVTFVFTDASMCESAYSFSRQAIGLSQTVKEIFTQDYFYYAKDPCDEIYRPEKRSADNLAESRLIVGNMYRYCVRAVGPNGYSSNDKCIDQVITWEGSVAGFVRLKEEAGGLPVEDVFISYSFDTEDFVINGNTTTGADGKFYIPIKAIDNNGTHPYPPMENDTPYPIKLYFSKITIGENSTFTHNFLCEGGAVPCEQSDSMVYLTHLDFNKPVEIIDDSTVNIVGKVLIDGTFCGIHDAEVCIVDHIARTSFTGERANCVQTTNDGSFAIGGVIGTRITLEVNYFNHTFVLHHPTLEDANMGDGFIVDPHVNYEGFIFRDVQKNTLQVEVFGGECRRFLGTSRVTYFIKGCNELDAGGSFGDLDVDFDKSSFSLDHYSVHSNYFVPAHKLEVFATVYDHIDMPTVQIDLRELPPNSTFNNVGIPQPSDWSQNVLGNLNEEETELLDEEEKKDDDKTKLYLLRYKFDGEISLHSQIGTQINACQVGSTPRFTLPARREVNVTVEVIENFPQRKDGIEVESCNVFEDGLQIWFKNELGYMGGEDDDNYLDSLTEIERLALTLCKDGCFFDLMYDFDPFTKQKSRAHRKQGFMIGPPWLAEPYLRYFTAELVRNGVSIEQVSEALVIGSYNRGPIDKIALPSHEPILILRDPPGGQSVAMYENIETKVFIKMESYDRHVDGGMFWKESLEGDAAQEPCIGGGFGVLSLLCEKFGIEIIGSLHSETHLNFLTEHTLNTNTASFTTTWSYTTSSDRYTAGKASDIFVVPTVNIEFFRIEKILDEDQNCVGEFDGNATAFDVSDNDNQAVSFYTYHDIIFFELPSYRKRLAGFDKQISDNGINCNASNNGPEARFFCESRNQTSAAIISWERFIAEYEFTNFQMLEGQYEGDVLKVNEWFDYVTSSNKHKYLDGLDLFLGSGLNTAERQYSGVLPKALKDYAEIVKEGEVDGAENLESVQYISFVGGGSSFAFSLRENKERSKEQKDYDMNDIYNLETSFEFDFSLYSGADIGPIEVREDFGPKFQTTGIATRFKTNIHSQGSSVGFILSDSDVGDRFDIKVSLDEKYGTFIFSTMPSSRSKCPHEAGTVKRVDPFMRIVEDPPQLVLPDEPMIFKIHVYNLGEDRSDLEIYSDQRENPGGLSFPGSFWQKPIEYLDGGEKLTLTFPVNRGPTEYRYSPISITLRSPCEFVGGDGNMFGIPDDERTQFTLELYNNKRDKLIDFAEPCPIVTLVAPSAQETYWVSAEDEYSHLVNVAVRNPQISLYGKFIDQKNNSGSRLEKVQIKYFDKLSHRVNVATVIQIVDGKDEVIDIDFATNMGNEDELGFAAIQWNIEMDGLADGEYKFWAESQCKEFPGAHSSFNGFKSDHANMIVDRERPKLFSLTDPVDGTISPGEGVVFEFTKDLDCKNHFELFAKVQGINRQFDNKVDGSNNLLVMCNRRKISFQFDITNTKLDDLVGKSFTTSLSGVTDLAGNKLKMGTIQHSLKFADVGMETLATKFEVTLNQKCDMNKNDVNVLRDVTKCLDLSPDEENRTTISSVSCKNSQDDVVEVIVEILPPTKTNQVQNRRLLGLKVTEGRSSTDIFYHSIDRVHTRSLQEETCITVSKLEVNTGTLGFLSEEMGEQYQKPDTTERNLLVSLVVLNSIGIVLLGSVILKISKPSNVHDYDGGNYDADSVNIK